MSKNSKKELEVAGTQYSNFSAITAVSRLASNAVPDEEVRSTLREVGKGVGKGEGVGKGVGVGASKDVGLGKGMGVGKGVGVGVLERDEAER